MWLLAVVLGLGLVVTGCSNGSTVGLPDGANCLAGSTQSCLCLGGALGTQTCRDDGSRFSPCAGCGANEADLPTASDLGGSTCGDCDGCCDGTTCVPLASQTAQGLCGPRGAVCAACTGGKVCASGTGACVADTGCGNCGDGCCRDNVCLRNQNGACGPSCTKCRFGVTCAASGCTDEIDANANFKIYVRSIQLEPKDPAGNDWDTVGKADPKACFAYEQGGVFYEGCTDSCDNTLTCTFDDVTGLIHTSGGTPLLFPGTVFLSGKLRVSGKDVDVAFDDLAGEAFFPPASTLIPVFSTGPFGKVTDITFELR